MGGFQHLIFLLGRALLLRDSVRRLGFGRELRQFALEERLSRRLFQRENLGLHRFRLLAIGGHTYLMRAALRRGGHRQIMAEFRRSEKCLQPVVVALRDRLELVVVTARATDGETEERERGRVRHVVQGIAPALHLIGGIDHVGPEEVERRRDLRVRIAREKFIAR